MTLLLWLAIWVVLSFAVAPLLGAVLRDARAPVPLTTKAGFDHERQLRERERLSA